MSDGKVVFEITGDASGIDRALNNATNSIARKTAKWTVLGQTAMNGLLSVGKAAFNGIGALMKNSFEYNATMESYLVNFETLLGSEEKAAAKIAELKEYAAKTPFSMNDLAGATRLLLSYGMASEEVSEALAYLGDISLGDANRMNSLALAFAQVTSNGRLMGTELLQFVNAGFNPLRIIADETGAAYDDLRIVMAGRGELSADFAERMEKAQMEVRQLGEEASEGAKMLAQIGEEGTISADLVKNAMRIATSEGHPYYMALAKASETALGQISTILDYRNILLGNLGKPGFDYLSNGLFPKVIEWLDKLNKAVENNGLEGFAKELPGIVAEAKKELVDLSSTIITAAYNAFTGKTLDKTEVQEAINSILAGIGDTLKAVADFFTVQLPATWAKVTAIIDAVCERLGIKSTYTTLWGFKEEPYVNDSDKTKESREARLDDATDGEGSSFSFKGWSNNDMMAAIEYISAYAQVRAGRNQYQGNMDNAMDILAISEIQNDAIDLSAFTTAVEELFASVETGDPVRIPAEWMEGTDKKLQDVLHGLNLSVPVRLLPIKTLWWLSGWDIGSLAPSDTGQAHAAGGIFPGTTRFLHTAGESGAEAILPLDTLWRKLGMSMDASFAANLDALQYRVMPPLPAADPTAALDGDALGDVIADKVAGAIRGMKVELDKKPVGRILAPVISKEIAQDVENRRWTG